MRNVLLSLSIAFVLLNGSAASAQIVTQNGKDTAITYYDGSSLIDVYNKIKSGSSMPVYLKWNVIASETYFGPGFDINASGFCDNLNCYNHMAGSPMMTNNAVWKSDAYDNSGFTGQPHDFHAVIGVSSPPPNGSTAVVRVFARDTVSNTQRTLTFIVMKNPSGISTTSSQDDVVMYPNPAREALNILYNEGAGVRTIAVYNLIGKLMGPVYKPSSPSSAKISLEDMPTGVYFLRLMDGQGHVIATRRFTRQ
jgi:hypothetical protein